MRKTKAVAYGNNQEAVVRELTALEIDRLFDEAEQRSMTTLDNLLDVHDLTSPMLAAMVGVDVDKIVAFLRMAIPNGIPAVERGQRRTASSAVCPHVPTTHPSEWGGRRTCDMADTRHTAPEYTGAVWEPQQD